MNSIFETKIYNNNLSYGPNIDSVSKQRQAPTVYVYRKIREVIDIKANLTFPYTNWFLMGCSPHRLVNIMIFSVGGTREAQFLKALR